MKGPCPNCNGHGFLGLPAHLPGGQTCSMCGGSGNE